MIISRRSDREKLTKSMHKKLTFTFLGVAAVLFALMVYLLVIMKDRGEDYQRTILSQQGYSTTNLPYRRGSITDRNGTVLAYSEEVYNLILDPSVILYTLKTSNPEPNRAATVNALTEIFGFSRDDLEKTLDEKKDSYYVRYARQLSAEEMNRFLSYQSEYNNAKDLLGKKLHSDKVTGVWFETEYKRTYPYNNLACSVMGFSGAESSEGHWGLEEYYNSALVGVNGKRYSFMNTDGDYETQTNPSVGGSTLVTTLDFHVQQTVERKVREFCEKNVYTDVGVVVMDPRNGEILGMATDKSFDCNDPTDYSASFPEGVWETMDDEAKTAGQNAAWRNFTVSDAYTPGSVSKELTVAMALEENVVTPATVFECDGGETVQGTFIGCNWVHGVKDLAGALMFSCNDAMMNIASRLNVATMLRWQRTFGLGRQTGIDLPGEATGILFDENKMTAVDIATCSFGQGYSTTMIQMAAAYCSMINGGYYYQPRVVRQLLDENGGITRTMEPVLVRNTVTPATCEFLRYAAYETVENGSASLAKVEGYTVGGKTGTAQKYPLESQQYVISFMGFTPIESPELLVYAVINEPEHEGSEVSNHGAIELERDIMQEIVSYLGVTKAR